MTHHDAERAERMSPQNPRRWLVLLATWSCLLLSASCLSTLHHARPDESPEEPNDYVLVAGGSTLYRAPSAKAAVATLPTPIPKESEDPCAVWPFAFRLVQHRGEWIQIESIPDEQSDFHPRWRPLDVFGFRLRFWVERTSLLPVSSYTRSVSDSDGAGFVIRAGMVFPKNCGAVFVQSQLTQFLDVDEAEGWIGESYSLRTPEKRTASNSPTDPHGAREFRRASFGNGFYGDVLAERDDLALFHVKLNWGEARIWIPSSQLEYLPPPRTVVFDKRVVIDFSDIDLSTLSPPQACFRPRSTPWSRSRPENSVLYWPTGEPAGTVGDIPLPRKRVDPRSLKCGTIDLDATAIHRDQLHLLLLCQPE